MPFVPLLAMASLVFTLITFLKSITNAKWSAALTQVIAWFSGVAIINLGAHTDYAEGIKFGATALSALNGWSLLLIGLVFSSMAGVLNDVKKAIDSTDSAAQPPLL